MDVVNSKERLLNSEIELSYSQRIAIADLIDKLKCCGNCGHYTGVCRRRDYTVTVQGDDICDNWTEKE